MMTKFFSEVAANLAADLVSQGLQVVGGPSVERIRDAIFERRIMSKVVCKLCTGFEELELAEDVGEDLLVVDRKFFGLPSVRRMFLEYLMTGDVNQDQIRKIYVSMYGSERVDRFERNLEEAVVIFERELNEALEPADRAAFARVRRDIREGVQSLKAGLDESTRAILTKQAQTDEKVVEMAEGVQQIKDTLQTLPTLSQDVDLSGEHQAQLEQARVLLRQFQTHLALEHLQTLKDRVWDKASSADKATMLALMGFAHLQLNDEPKAANMLIAALDFNPGNARTMVNAALGFLLQGNTERCEELARAAMAKDPLIELSSAMLVYASPTDEPWELVVAKTSSSHRETVDVAMALGKVASERGLLEEAERWYKVAVENNPIDHPDPKGKLADVLLTRLLANQPEWPMPGLVQPAASELQEILALYDSAWEGVAHTDLRGPRLSWLVNRATVKSLLGNVQGAIHDLDEAHTDRPDDAELIRHRALLALRTRDLSTAAALFREIQDNKKTPDASFWLGLVLFEDDKLPEAHSLIQAFIEQRDATHLGWKDAVYALVLIKLRRGDLAGAKDQANHLREEFRNDPGALALCARVAQCEGQTEEVKVLLRDALAQITATANMVTRYRLVDELYANGLFQEAASLLEAMVDTDVDENPTRQLLACYYRAGNLEPALEICENLRQKHGPLRFATAMESAIHEEIGGLEQAKQVCDKYLESFPSDVVILLRLAAVSYRLKQFNDIDNILDKELDTSALSFEARTQLAQLYLLRHRPQRALEIAYETRRHFISQPDAHLAYVNVYLSSADDLHDWLEVEEVGIGTAVQLDHSIAAGQSWIVIEDKPDADIGRGEFSPSHTLAQLLLGKRKGEFVSVSSGIEEEKYTVRDIRSKFVYAWAQSLEAYGHWFPGVPGIWRGRVEMSPDGRAHAESFRSLFEMLDRVSEYQRQSEQLYQERKCTIGSLAEILGQNPILLRGRLVTSPDLGLYCFSGNHRELEDAIALLASQCTLIVDIVSLLTMYDLEIGDAVVAEVGKLGVLRSNLELIDALLAQESMLEKDHLRIGKEGHQYFKTLVTAELVERNRNALQDLHAWTEANCDILPWRAALAVPRGERLKLGGLLGQTFLDTILVAADDKRVLYSDDGLLRELARNEHQIAGVWSQAVLEFLHQKRTISDATYNRAIIELACMNYHHTSVNAIVLLEAARMAEWRPAYPLLQVLKMLGGTQSNVNSAVLVAVKFAYSLWSERLLPDQYERLVLRLLDGLTAGRGIGRRDAIQRFLAVAEQRFQVAPVEIHRLRGLAEVWLRAHVV